MRRHQIPVIIAVFTLTLAGCASSGKSPAPTYGGGGAQGGDASYEAPAASGHAAYKSSAPAAPAARPSFAPESSGADDGMTLNRRESSPRPEHRPGLGTSWGENRSSHVRHTTFERTSSSPFAALSVYYNDAEGIAAQMAHRGNEGISPYYATTPNGNITVALESASGGVLPGRLAGERTYVVGRQGDRYNIVIRNRTGGRFEVVTSVDGLDVIDGGSASVSKRGYLLPPHGKLVIDGFRRSDSTVAAFRFGKVKDSYAARTTGDRNVGVIGLAFFGERGTEWTSDEIRRRETADPFPGDYAQPPPVDRVY